MTPRSPPKGSERKARPEGAELAWEQALGEEEGRGGEKGRIGASFGVAVITQAVSDDHA